MPSASTGTNTTPFQHMFNVDLIANEETRAILIKFNDLNQTIYAPSKIMLQGLDQCDDVLKQEATNRTAIQAQIKLFQEHYVFFTQRQTKELQLDEINKQLVQKKLEITGLSSTMSTHDKLRNSIWESFKDSFRASEGVRMATFFSVGESLFGLMGLILTLSVTSGFLPLFVAGLTISLACTLYCTVTAYLTKRASEAIYQTSKQEHATIKTAHDALVDEKTMLERNIQSMDARKTVSLECNAHSYDSTFFAIKKSDGENAQGQEAYTQTNPAVVSGL